MLRSVFRRSTLLWQEKRAISTVGLINGVTAETIAACAHYQPIEGAVSWESLNNNLLQAIKEDGFDKDKLNLAMNTSEKWCQGDEVWGRDDLLKKIHTDSERQGRLSCLLGGKNTGKSALFSKLQMDNVLVLDMRLCADIKLAVLSALKDAKNKHFFQRAVTFLKDTIVITQRHHGMMDLVEISDKDSLRELLLSLRDEKGRLTVVIDEANLAFNKRMLQEHKDWVSARQDLEILVAMTKHNHEVNLLPVCCLGAAFCLAADSHDIRSMSSWSLTNTTSHIAACKKTWGSI